MRLNGNYNHSKNKDYCSGIAPRCDLFNENF